MKRIKQGSTKKERDRAEFSPCLAQAHRPVRLLCRPVHLFFVFLVPPVSFCSFSLLVFTGFARDAVPYAREAHGLFHRPYGLFAFFSGPRGALVEHPLH
jgi:hypothetical protein